jgi:dTDP-4-dehydrorhamnose reductase
MNKVMVTGAAGFLGRALRSGLAGIGDVTGVTSRPTSESGMVTADLRSADACRGLVASVQPDVIVHAAAYPDPDFCEEQPDEARRLNVESVRHLSGAAGLNTLFVFISTDYVFDGQAPPYAEDDRRNPVSVYGATKCEAEDLLSGRMNALIVRMPLLMGAGRSLEKSGFIYQLQKSLSSSQPEVLDDVLMRFPTWIEDVARAIAFLVTQDASGVFHVSAPDGGTRYGWTQRMARVLGVGTSHLSASRQIVPRRALRPLNSQLSAAKLLALGFPGFTAFEDVAAGTLRRFGYSLPS